jgi:hypothetical protein
MGRDFTGCVAIKGECKIPTGMTLPSLRPFFNMITSTRAEQKTDDLSRRKM